MERLDNDGKDISLHRFETLSEDLVPWRQDALGVEDVLYLPFVLTQSQRQGRRSRIGDLEEVQKSRNVHLPAGITVNALAQVEDHIRLDLLQPVNHRVDLFLN